MRYLVVVEPTETGYSAYCPDVLGCVAAGDTEEETLRLMQEALILHLDGMRADGEPIPLPVTTDPNAIAYDEEDESAQAHASWIDIPA